MPLNRHTHEQGGRFHLIDSNGLLAFFQKKALLILFKIDGDGINTVA